MSGGINRESYDAIADRWNVQRITLSAAEERILSMLVDGLAPGAVILDLGCGTGQPVATHLASAGFRIVGVDQSPAMLQFAQERLPTHQWIHSRLEDYAFESTIAAAVAWDSLFHIPRVAQDDILTRLRRALPVGGRFAVTAGGSDQSPFTDSMFDRTFFYDSHPPDVTLATLMQSGFRIAHHEYLNVPDGGRDKGRIAVVATAV